MQSVKIQLFGRFEATAGTQPVAGMRARKVQELFSLLALSSGLPLSREVLADRLWPEAEGQASRKYLRQVLWQLRRALDIEDCVPGHFGVTSDWITFSPSDAIEVDGLAFEVTYRRTRSTPRDALLSDADRCALVAAVGFYRGELLEGWYNDWCVEARGAYRRMYAEMLDLLVDDAEKRGAWAEAIAYCEASLKDDSASERAHLHLMNLRHLTGNRTAALRQYERCADSLRDEFGVEPSTRTEELLQQIRLPASSSHERRRAEPIDDETALALVKFHETVPKIQEAISCLQALQSQLHASAAAAGSSGGAEGAPSATAIHHS